MLIFQGYFSAKVVCERKGGHEGKILVCIIPGLPIGNNTIQFMKPKSKSRTYHKLLSHNTSNSTKPILIQTDVQKFGDITFYIFISPSVYSLVLDNRQDIMDNWANCWGLELTKLVHGSNPLRAKKPASIKISEGIMQALSGNDVSTAVRIQNFVIF